MELEYPMDPEQEQPTISDSDFRSQIIKEREVEVLLLENPIREKHHKALGILTEMEEGEIQTTQKE